MKEQAYNIIKTKDLRTQRQSDIKKFKEARFKISPHELEEHTLGEIGFAAVLAVLVTRASQSKQHGSRLDLCTLVLVIEGWSRLPPIQYQQSWSEMLIDNICSTRQGRQRSIILGARTRFEDEKEGREEEDNKDDSTTGYAGSELAVIEGTELAAPSFTELAVIEGTELASPSFTELAIFKERCMKSLGAIQSQFKFLTDTLQDFGTMPIFKGTFAQDLDLLEHHLTKEIISHTDCKTILTKLITTFENAFNLEFKERMQKYTRFDSQSFKDAMFCNMDSIGKYMLEIILYQQRTPQLLKQKKLMQTQEDQSNPIQALNIDSLKVDLVVIQNTCSEKEDTNSETASSKSVKECSLDKLSTLQYNYVGIKSLLDAVRITVAQVYVNTAPMKLVLLMDFIENMLNMDQDFAHMVAASKVPMLKPGKYEIWRMRIEQYIHMIDYALWEVIKNGATLPKTTTLKFNSIKDAKKLLEAVEKRFGGNEATKKTQRNLLKQQYENFTAPSSEMLDQTFNRLQKLRNKADLDTMSMDDLYNNLNVYEPEVKRMSSSSSSTQNMAFVSFSNNNTSSTNEAVNTAHGVSTASTQVNAANSTNIDNLSDDVIFESGVLQLPQEGTFSKERRAPRNQDNKNNESSRRSVPMETSTSITLVSCDGLGLKSVEEKLKVYKANKSIYSQDIKGLKFEIRIGEITIRELRKNLEIVQKEKDGIQLNVDKFEHASKSLNKLIECQIVDNCKKGLGYENSNAVPSPYTGKFMPPTPDLSFTGLDEFVNEPVVENSKAMSSKEELKVVRKNDALIIEE
ncbi:hypothetical protein Tco_0607122 [Tanacetum coccineum]